jgi:hypothetical protein
VQLPTVMVQMPVKLNSVIVAAFAGFGCRKNIEKTAAMTKAVIFRIPARTFEGMSAMIFLRRLWKTQ